MKRVFVSHSLTAVHHALNVLAAAGIRAVVRNQYLAGAMGELPPAECQPELWVLDDADAWRAGELLSSPPSQAEGWTCECGEALGAAFTQCWSCGAYRPTEALRR